MSITDYEEVIHDIITASMHAFPEGTPMASVKKELNDVAFSANGEPRGKIIEKLRARVDEFAQKLKATTRVAS